MYHVYGSPKTRGFRVIWMLEELGQSFDVTHAAPRSDEAFSVNALGKVPALKDGDEIMTDSVAIMSYLADKHGAFTAPPGTPERARQDAMTLWLVDELDALLWTAAKHSFILPEKMRVPDVKPTLKDEFARNVSILEKRIKGPFLMGDVMTVPDFLAVHCLGWSMIAGFHPLSDGIKAYSKRLRSRPAYQAAAAR